MPEISVIVPVYNTEQYIHRCVDSILAQTFENFELILVDDGSTDASGEICDEYALIDNRVQVFHQENRGQAAARNYALDWIYANSESKFISFVDSDDWIHPQFLELLRDGVVRFNVNICQCGHLETESVETPSEVIKSISCITPEEQYINHYSAFMWDKLFSRSCWQVIRFPEGQVYEDVAIWYKMLFAEKKLALVHAELYCYYTNYQSTVRKNWTPVKFAQIKAWEAQLEFAHGYGNREVLLAVLQRYCWVYKHQCDEIRESNLVTEKEKKRYSSKLIRRFRKVLIQHKTELKKMDLWTTYGYWAFPEMTGLYWKIRTIFGIIKKHS